MVLNLSWPAVSQTCNLTFWPSTLIVFILKSIPTLWVIKLTYSWHVTCGEVIFREPKEHTRLADWRVSDYNQLDKVIILLFTPHIILVHLNYNSIRTNIKNHFLINYIFASILHYKPCVLLLTWVGLLPKQYFLFLQPIYLRNHIVRISLLKKVKVWITISVSIIWILELSVVYFHNTDFGMLYDFVLPWDIMQHVWNLFILTAAHFKINLL